MVCLAILKVHMTTCHLVFSYLSSGSWKFNLMFHGIIVEQDVGYPT